MTLHDTIKSPQKGEMMRNKKKILLWVLFITGLIIFRVFAITISDGWYIAGLAFGLIFLETNLNHEVRRLEAKIEELHSMIAFE